MGPGGAFRLDATSLAVTIKNSKFASVSLNQTRYAGLDSAIIFMGTLKMNLDIDSIDFNGGNQLYDKTWPNGNRYYLFLYSLSSMSKVSITNSKFYTETFTN